MSNPGRAVSRAAAPSSRASPAQDSNRVLALCNADRVDRQACRSASGSAPRVATRVLAHAPQSRFVDTATLYGVWSAKLTSEQLPPEELCPSALAQLERLAALAYEVCYENQWKVILLRGVWNEFTDEERHHSKGEPVLKGHLLGFHRSVAGHGAALEIAVKLGEGSFMYSFGAVRETLAHELAHFTYKNHGDGFKELQIKILGDLQKKKPFKPYHEQVWRPQWTGAAFEGMFNKKLWAGRFHLLFFVVVVIFAIVGVGQNMYSLFAQG